jgi:hypothetical protein
MRMQALWMTAAGLTPVNMDSYSDAGQGHNDEAYDTTLVLRFIDGG